MASECGGVYTECFDRSGDGNQQYVDWFLSGCTSFERASETVSTLDRKVDLFGECQKKSKSGLNVFVLYNNNI
jgi:hypothetical protein